MRRSISTRTTSAKARTESTGFRRRIARLGALDQLGHPVEEVEVALEGELDARPQHLDRDLAAVGGDGEMHLGDRGGGDRRVVEAGEQRVDRLAELGLDDAPGLGAGESRQMVLQLRQVGRDLFAQKIGAGRQGLAELDEGRTHLLQRRRQALARPAGIAAAREQPCPGDQRRRDAQDLQREQRIVPRQAQRHAQQAPGDCRSARNISRCASPSAGPRRPASCRARRRWRSPTSRMRRASSRCGGKRRMLSCR